ncbi:MAG TPA: DUF2007 domain-containing protein [Bacteroidota bacterium]|nr:DUF2007 domain-containing protein [Bacteroidota bacterium]
MKSQAEDVIPVAFFSSEIEAELAHATLAAAGIESYLKYEDMGGMMPTLLQTEGVALLVRKDQYAEAQTVLTTPASDSPD